MDLSKFSSEDLIALRNNDMSSVSTEGLRMLAEMLPQEPEEKSHGALPRIREVLGGMTLNLADEAGAAVATTATGAMPFTDKWAERYKDIHGTLEHTQNAYRRDHPYESTALNIAGALPTAAVTAGAVANATRGAAPIARLLTGAGAGALEGGAAGYGHGTGDDRAVGGALGGFAGLVLGPLGAEGANIARVARNNKDELMEALKRGDNDAVTARHTLDESGKATKDPIATEVVRQGVPEGVVGNIRGTTKQTKDNMRKMVNLIELADKNPRAAAVNRPAKIIGDSLVGRIRTIAQAKRKAGSQMDAIANSLKGKGVDFEGPVQQFQSRLQEMGVSLVRKPNGEIVPRFEGSAIEGLSGPERVIARMITRMQRDGVVDAYEGHTLKRFIDENVNFSKQQEGISGTLEFYLKELRHGIDTKLDDQFDAYKAVNEAYAETKTILDELQSLAGTKIDIQGKGANHALGTISRRVLSNYASGRPLVEALEVLDDVAKRHGGEFDDDIIMQALFISEMEKLFGTVASTSLQSEVQKGVTGALRGQGLAGAALDAAADNVGALAGINRDNLLKSLKQLLKTEHRSGRSVIPARVD